MARLARIPIGIAFALATLVVVAVAYVARGDAIFSPGELNSSEVADEPLGGVRSHSELAHNCAACHALPWSSETMSSRCQDCHTEIRRQIVSREPMHGQLTMAQDCRACHGEHLGADGELMSFANFDHACTAFPLTGRHESVACAKCHVDSVFRGTVKSCVGCHADPPAHRGKFGLDCAQCHHTESFKPFVSHAAAPVGFNHDKTAFPLTGVHQAVSCMNCHAQHVQPGTTHTCANCHQEPKIHAGRFGVACANCHTTATWQGAVVEHRFPLNHGGGPKHVAKACATCHDQAGDYTTYTCYNCHRHEPAKTADKHLRRLITKIDDCFNCHPTGRKKRDDPPKHPPVSFPPLRDFLNLQP